MRRRIDRYLPQLEVNNLERGGVTNKQMDMELAILKAKEDAEVEKQLEAEQTELIDTIEQLTGSRINKIALSYLIDNEEERVEDKSDDITEAIIDRIGRQEEEEEEEAGEAPKLVSLNEAFAALSVLQTFEQQQEQFDVVMLRNFRLYKVDLLARRRQRQAEGQQQRLDRYFH